MDKKDLRIIYMGTPDFAVESLKALHEDGYNIVGVITMPDKPAGRGHKIQFSPVKQYALDNDLRLLQPEKLKDEAFLAELKSLQADLQIVVAFRMLPEVVWDMPRLGTFNLHASLLPQYRGAAPINWAVINGETETGATTFFLTHEIDTGNIILQEKLPISKADTAGDVHDRLMVLGSGLVLKTVDQILSGNVQVKPQPQSDTLKTAPKIFKETCRVDWIKTATELYNFVRGLSPYPTAWTEITLPGGETLGLKIYETEKAFGQHNLPAGTLLTDNKTFIKIATSDGYLHLLSVQLAGKKRMKADELLRGYKIEGCTVN
jgi:methionyl-tRNA formyltransferase